jgi:hypothetical protein
VLSAEPIRCPAGIQSDTDATGTFSFVFFRLFVVKVFSALSVVEKKF